MEDSKQQDGKSKADRAWDNIVEAFSPIASLFTMRTVFLVALLAGIGFWIGWRDIKLFALSAAWAIAGVAIAYHGRKFLVPEVIQLKRSSGAATVWCAAKYREA